MYSKEVQFDIFDLSARQETLRCSRREEEGTEGGGGLMTPHPGVARTLYLAKKSSYNAFTAGPAFYVPSFRMEVRSIHSITAIICTLSSFV